MATSLQYTRSKKTTSTKRLNRGRTSTFFPSFIGLSIRGDDLYVCEATKRFTTRLKSATVKNFFSHDSSKRKPKLDSLKSFKGQFKPVILSWPREKTMVRELYVKDANLQDLRKTLTLQLDSLFPLKPEDAYFDLYPCGLSRVTKKNTTERKVYLFAINKKELDVVLDRLKAVGLTPSRVITSSLAFLPMLEKKMDSVARLHGNNKGEYVYDFYHTGGLEKTHICQNEEKLKQELLEDSPEAVVAVGFGGKELSDNIVNILPEETVITYHDFSCESEGAAIYETHDHSYDFQLLRPFKRMANYQNIYMVCMMALLLSLLISIPQIAQIKDNERLNLVNAEIEGVKKQAFALKKLEGIAKAKNALTAALGSQKGYVPRADILLELSTILPESVWIKELSVNGDRFEIEGVTDSLPDTMFLLEDSHLFSDVELVPPLTKDKDGKEHFRLKGSLS